jgi:hypothetical protein
MARRAAAVVRVSLPPVVGSARLVVLEWRNGAGRERCRRTRARSGDACD